MTTMTTETVAITIDAPLRPVAPELADPAPHADPATQSLSGPSPPVGSPWLPMTRAWRTSARSAAPSSPILPAK